MASQFPPETLPISDPGNVPEFWIDGLGAVCLRAGIFRAAYYSYRPALCGGPSVWHPDSRQLTVKLVFPMAALSVMRRQVDMVFTTEIAGDAGDHPIASC